MKNIVNYDNYRIENVSEVENFDTEHFYAVDEGFLSWFTSMFKKIGAWFLKPDKLQKSVEATVTDMGDNFKHYYPKTSKPNETIYVLMGDGKDKGNNFTMALTKMASLPDDSGLFQITGTTSISMLKSLVNSDKNGLLTKNSVMAMIPKEGMEKGKPTTMKILKNIIPNGLNYTTKSFVMGVASGVNVDKKMSLLK